MPLDLGLTIAAFVVSLAGLVISFRSADEKTQKAALSVAPIAILLLALFFLMRDRHWETTINIYVNSIENKIGRETLSYEQLHRSVLPEDDFLFSKALTRAVEQGKIHQKMIIARDYHNREFLIRVYFAPFSG